jgi:hypothetical protein
MTVIPMAVAICAEEPTNKGVCVLSPNPIWQPEGIVPVGVHSHESRVLGEAVNVPALNSAASGIGFTRQNSLDFL